jgi:tetratricopeptide (TPR) repeat protein
MTPSTTNLGSKVGRARRRLSQLWQAPMFLIGLLAIVGVAASTPWRLTPQEREFERLVSALRHALEHNDPGDAVVDHAETVKLQMHHARSRIGEANFLIGSAYYRQAQQKPALKAKEIWPQATQYLEEALARGVPETDKVALQYRLGFSLYQQNTALPRAIELMTLGVEKGAEQPLAGYQLLVQANLKQTPPNLDAALAASGRVLDLTPERETEAIALAHLQQADLFIRKELRGDALKELERIGSKASLAVRVKARLLQARCCEEDGLWSKAIPLWQELLANTALVEGGQGRILYAMGWCYHKLTPTNDAEAIDAWSKALKFPGPEGQAAGLHLGKLRLSLGGTHTVQALADWNEALANVKRPEDYRNPLVRKEDVLDWFKQAITKFHDAREPQQTQAVAELFRKLSPGGVAEFGIGEAAEELAKLLADKLKAGGVDGVKPADVAAQYRLAAEAFEQAANARLEADRAEPLWRCSQCYVAAHETTKAQQMLLQFVKLETNELRLAEGWQILGDLYRQEGNAGNARQAYYKCLEIPNTPFVYRARYYLAVEEIDNKNFEKAREILKQNLAGGSTPDIDRTWQEKSQFKMALLLMQIEKYGEAEIHMKEFINLFQENQYVLVVKEQLGECYRRLAEIERVEANRLVFGIKESTPDYLREALQEKARLRQNEARKFLMKAFTAHKELADELEQTAARTQLTPHEQTLLRRAKLSIGGCYLDGERHAEAMDKFKELQTKHRRTLESFWASRFICYALYRMPLQDMPKLQADEFRTRAKESVRLVAEDVTAMPPDHEVFRGKGVWQRDDWLRWTDDARKQLDAAPRDDSKRRILD